MKRLEEIGTLQLKLDTSGEQIVKLEGQWEDLAKAMGEKVATAVEEKWGDLMDQVTDEIEMLQRKLESVEIK